ncbi:hypothetical protein N658DRAFT_196490 [Parathielavia hyrcaniae]|uniref:BZIP domain-containing protein n=1 Tax=Parathielavia hyrcaniae TaxID=113614 RepID=A0AAN6T4L5_9PEZI|nr:hypothetical protein N658DRAFT_196490 [Parathielavia hyrcaniae]
MSFFQENNSAVNVDFFDFEMYDNVEQEWPGKIGDYSLNIGDDDEEETSPGAFDFNGPSQMFGSGFASLPGFQLPASQLSGAQLSVAQLPDPQLFGALLPAPQVPAPQLPGSNDGWNDAHSQYGMGAVANPGQMMADPALVGSRFDNAFQALSVPAQAGALPIFPASRASSSATTMGSAGPASPGKLDEAPKPVTAPCHRAGGGKKPAEGKGKGKSPASVGSGSGSGSGSGGSGSSAANKAKNAEAAKRSRAKKKAMEQSLVCRAYDGEARNGELVASAQRLRDEIAALKTELVDHANRCPGGGRDIVGRLGDSFSARLAAVEAEAAAQARATVAGQPHGQPPPPPQHRPGPGRQRL